MWLGPGELLGHAGVRCRDNLHAFVLHSLGNFNENAASCLGMEEGDLASAGADPRCLVYQGNPFFLQFGQCFFDVFYLEGHMLETTFTAIFLDEFGNRAIGRGRDQ